MNDSKILSLIILLAGLTSIALGNIQLVINSIKEVLAFAVTTYLLILLYRIITLKYWE